MPNKFKYWLQQYRLSFRYALQNGSFFYLLAALVILPVWAYPVIQQKSIVQDTLFVIDVSESMNVRDVDYPKPQTSRLDLAKYNVRNAMSQLPCGSRISVGLFAGDEIVILFEPLEICQHFPAIEQVVERLDSRMRWIGDSWVIRALMATNKEAKKRQLNYVFISDFDEMPHHSAPRLTELLELKDKANGLLLGVGGETPQPIPRLNGNNEIIGYWTQEEAVLEGNHPNLLAFVKTLQPGEKASEGMLDEVTEHLSAFNRNVMQTTAQAANVTSASVKMPIDAIREMSNKRFQKVTQAERDARWILAIISTLLLLIGWFWQSLIVRFG